MLPIAMVALLAGIVLSVLAAFAGRERPELWLAATFEFSVVVLLAGAASIP